MSIASVNHKHVSVICACPRSRSIKFRNTPRRAAAAAVLLLAIAGCSSVNAIVPLGAGSPSPTPTPVTGAAVAVPDASAGPSAQIQIDYAHTDDWLDGVTVREYDGAHLLANKRGFSGQAAIVRFEGGTPFWEIEADRGTGAALLSHLGANENKKYALKSLSYGVVPDGFTQVQPDGLPAQPLQAGRYYVFTVHRGSGSTSHQAIHVDDDGSIEGYDAEPMAGTSFSLCCNVSPGFASASDSGQTSEP
jgi:hypothetical protein